MGSPSQPSPNGEKTAYQLATEKLPPSTREQLYRLFTQAKLPENDPIWALVGVQAGILQPFVTNQPHVEALNKALSTVERAADRIERRSFYLNLGWPAAAVALTAALCIGGMAVWHDRAEKAEQKVRDQAAQAQRNAVEAQLAHNLNVAGAKLDFAVTNLDANQWGHTLTVFVVPGKQPSDWKLTKATIDEEGKAAIALVDPAASPTPAASPHRR